ncbi:MAG: 3-deoxy-7-phosphoheptulonate synthase [Clostridiales bacterium]
MNQQSNEIKPIRLELGKIGLGAGEFQLIAGPCSVENREQVLRIAQAVKAAGATILRGGAFKPRSSPYTFQGLREHGIELLLAAKRATGLAIVTEITELGQLPLFTDVDIIQVGARNMQNFELLRELSHSQKPILLKRGMGNTLEELLLSAEYLLAGGNQRVILCERGIRTFEHSTRYTLDISAVPVLKSLTGLPVIVDPSHGTGFSHLVGSMALAATAAGADGLMIEVHDNPAAALSDGQQSLTPEQFLVLAEQVRKIRAVL